MEPLGYSYYEHSADADLAFLCCGLVLPDSCALADHYASAHVVSLAVPPSTAAPAFDHHPSHAQFAYSPPPHAYSPPHTAPCALGGPAPTFGHAPAPALPPALTPAAWELEPGTPDSSAPPTPVYPAPFEPGPQQFAYEPPDAVYAPVWAAPPPKAPVRAAPYPPRRATFPPHPSYRPAAPAPAPPPLPAPVYEPVYERSPARGGKPFPCPHPGCSKSYKQAAGLKYHLTTGTCDGGPAPRFACAACRRAFRSQDALRAHAEVHLVGQAAS